MLAFDVVGAVNVAVAMAVVGDVVDGPVVGVDVVVAVVVVAGDVDVC
jgi:hypothetical protein